jgi:membrane protein implicated in regulation of membrane protease activity
MPHLLARLTTPLTYLLWIMMIIGMVDHFFGPYLPPPVAEIGFYALWLVAAATWFGWRQRKRDEAAAKR